MKGKVVLLTPYWEVGPVLFTVYVNDLLSVPKHCKTSGYVDDTKVFLSLPPCDVTEARVALNQDLSEISSWCCENSLLISPDKTKLLVIGVPQLLRNLPSLSLERRLSRFLSPEIWASISTKHFATKNIYQN